MDKALLVAKARAKVRASLSKRHVKRSQRAKLTVRVSAAGMIPTGKVRVYDGRKRLAAARLTRAKEGKAVIRLPRLGKVGRHEIRTAYRGSKFAKPATGRTLTLTVGP